MLGRQTACTVFSVDVRLPYGGMTMVQRLMLERGSRGTDPSAELADDYFAAKLELGSGKVFYARVIYRASDIYISCRKVPIRNLPYHELSFDVVDSDPRSAATFLMVNLQARDGYFYGDCPRGGFVRCAKHAETLETIS